MSEDSNNVNIYVLFLWTMFNKTYKNAGCSVYMYASLCTLLAVLIISSIPCKKWIWIQKVMWIWVSLYVLHSINVIVIQGAFCLWCSFVKCADASIFQWLGMSPKIVLSTTCLCKTFIHFVFFLLIIPSDKKKKTEFSELIVLGRPSSGCLGHNGTSHLFFLWR